MTSSFTHSCWLDYYAETANHSQASRDSTLIAQLWYIDFALTTFGQIIIRNWHESVNIRRSTHNPNFIFKSPNTSSPIMIYKITTTTMEYPLVTASKEERDAERDLVNMIKEMAKNLKQRFCCKNSPKSPLKIRQHCSCRDMTPQPYVFW